MTKDLLLAGSVLAIMALGIVLMLTWDREKLDYGDGVADAFCSCAQSMQLPQAEAGECPDRIERLQAAIYAATLEEEES